ncbi:hypothetical protein [Nostoc sp.]
MGGSGVLLTHPTTSSFTFKAKSDRPFTKCDRLYWSFLQNTKRSR